MKVRQNAPRSVGRSSIAACSMLLSAAPCASNAPTMSESDVAAPLAIPSSRARLARSAVLTRFPLCPRATPVPASVVRKIGCEFSQVVEPVVE
ncbi:Uncharacterised protein [Mycobacteroides abscessus subsp. abscessus]|nr:Uncharacterised protein [Mycobacteroides abscessus subsp. abscessus]